MEKLLMSGLSFPPVSGNGTEVRQDKHTLTHYSKNDAAHC